MRARDDLRVVRIYHSGVVTAWRQRDREQRSLGTELALITPVRWNEGGRDVRLDRSVGAGGADDFVTGVRTFGRHPYRFVYDPVGLVRALLRTSRPDTLDIHEEPASLAALEVWVLATLTGRGAPFCLYDAQNIEKRYPPPFRWIERFLLRRAAAVHTCNDAAGHILRRKGYSGRICNLGLGVDVDRFTPAAGDRRSAGLHIGYVGRLEPHKGVAVLVDAVARLPRAHLTIVGDGPERGALERSVNTLGIGDRVRITGFAPNDQLPEVYRGFDIVAVPSLETSTWIEQFGRVALEAMACGVPVVASDSGSLPEVVGDAGILVPPGDADALVKALESLDRADAELLGRAARERSLHWSWPSVAERQRELYEQVAAT
jgi:glycosyltransferase involved in cell wall biosynthesis